MFHFWSGPGRKDADTVKGGLEGEMRSRERIGGGSTVDSGVSSGFGSGSDRDALSDTNSPPKSVLHLDRCYRSQNPSYTDLGDSLRMSHEDGTTDRSGASTPSEPMTKLEVRSPPNIPVDLPQCRIQHSKLQYAKPHTQSHLNQVLNADDEHEGTPESPTHASKVLPKVETSLGVDEAGQVAAKIEAADTRPTFYENVVEGAVKRKRLAQVQTTTSPPTSGISGGSVSPTGTASSAAVRGILPPATSEGAVVVPTIEVVEDDGSIVDP